MIWITIAAAFLVGALAGAAGVVAMQAIIEDGAARTAARGDEWGE